MRYIGVAIATPIYLFYLNGCDYMIPKQYDVVGGGIAVSVKISDVYKYMSPRAKKIVSDLVDEHHRKFEQFYNGRMAMDIPIVIEELKLESVTDDPEPKLISFEWTHDFSLVNRRGFNNKPKFTFTCDNQTITCSCSYLPLIQFAMYASCCALFNTYIPVQLDTSFDLFTIHTLHMQLFFDEKFERLWFDNHNDFELELTLRCLIDDDHKKYPFKFEDPSFIAQRIFLLNEMKRRGIKHPEDLTL
jgi:hypothetical protein